MGRSRTAKVSISGSKVSAFIEPREKNQSGVQRERTRFGGIGAGSRNSFRRRALRNFMKRVWQRDEVQARARRRISKTNVIFMGGRF